MIPGAAEQLAAADAPEQAADMQVKPLDTGEIARHVNEFFQKKREDRRPYERIWYTNAAALDGKTNSSFNAFTGKMAPALQPPHRRYFSFNLIWSKFRAKVSKLTNSRPRPIVSAANQEYNEILNARMTQQALLYASRKGNWQAKFTQAVAAAEITGKTFLWVYWDPSVLATFKNPTTGKPFDADGEDAGDVRVEVGSAFEVLVDDLGETTLGKQKEFQRVTAVLLEDAKAQYPLLQGKDLKSDVGDEDLFQFERQIADLGISGRGSGGMAIGSRSYDQVKGDSKKYILKKEHFWAPTSQYPKGRYAVVIADVVVRQQMELPYRFWDILDNPFPVVEIAADLTPNRFWPQTMIERLRPPAEAMDTVFAKILEDLDLSMHGKWLIPVAARVPKNAFTSEAGEKIYYNYFPGMPPPQQIQPRGVSTDAWRLLDWARKMIDDVSNIWPSTVGGQQAGVTSGFMANVMNEATDAVFGPDKVRAEKALEDLMFKVRRLMKQGYTVDRLVSITSRSQIPAIFEFHQSMIDEHAEIKVEIGSALSDFKATRLQQLQEMRASGLFGPADAPQTKRAVLALADLGGVEEEIDPTFDDTNRALIENMRIGKGEDIEPPAPWQTDAIHVEMHFHALNSPEFDSWTPEQKAAMMRHVVLHLRRHNPQMGLEIAQMLAGVAPGPETDELIFQLESQVNMMAPPPAPEGAGGGPPQGPPAPPQPAPAAPPAA